MISVLKAYLIKHEVTSDYLNFKNYSDSTFLKIPRFLSTKHSSTLKNEGTFFEFQFHLLKF